MIPRVADAIDHVTAEVLLHCAICRAGAFYYLLEGRKTPHKENWMVFRLGQSVAWCGNRITESPRVTQHRHEQFSPPVQSVYQELASLGTPDHC